MKSMKKVTTVLALLFAALAFAEKEPVENEKYEWFALVDYKKKGFGFELHKGIEEKILSECEEGSIIVDVSHAIFGYSFTKDYLYVELAIRHLGSWDGKSHTYLIAQKDKHSDWSTCRMLIPSTEARKQFFEREIGSKDIEDSIVEKASGLWEKMRR